jgi:hypothetical protein
LCVEGHVVGFDAWKLIVSEVLFRGGGIRAWGKDGLRGGGKEDRPSSFPSTLFTAPEQPPQLILTLNLYVCSADILPFPSYLSPTSEGYLGRSGVVNGSRSRELNGNVGAQVRDLEIQV